MKEALQFKLKELKQEYEKGVVCGQEEYDYWTEDLYKETSVPFPSLTTKIEKIEAAKKTAQDKIKSINENFVNEQKEIIEKIKQSTGENFDYLVENLEFTLKFVGEE